MDRIAYLYCRLDTRRFETRVPGCVNARDGDLGVLGGGGIVVRLRYAATVTMIGSLMVVALIAQQTMIPLGREFMPPLNESSILDMPVTIPRAFPRPHTLRSSVSRRRIIGKESAGQRSQGKRRDATGISNNCAIKDQPSAIGSDADTHFSGC